MLNVEWVNVEWVNETVSAVLKLQALSVHKVHEHQSSPVSSVVLIVLLALAELLIVWEADVTV